MKILKLSVTVALLLFVGATVGLLIAHEVTPPDSVPVAEGSDTSTAQEAEGGAIAEAPEQSVPADVMASVDSPEGGPATPSPADGGPETSTAGEVAAVEGDTPEPESICVVDAIYFHNTLRCHTCRTIEETAKAVLEAEFSEEFAIGQMRWSTINMERQQHYVEEFDLVQPTLILVRTVGEAQSDWVALDETWSLIRSETRFADYVENETRAFLETCP